MPPTNDDPRESPGDIEPGELPPFEGLQEEGFEEGLGVTDDFQVFDPTVPASSSDDPTVVAGSFDDLGWPSLATVAREERTAGGCLWGFALLVVLAVATAVFLFSGGEDPAPTGANFSPADGSGSAEQASPDLGSQDDGDAPTGGGSTEEPSDLPDAAALGLVVDPASLGEADWTFAEDPPAVECDIPGMDASLPPIGSSTGHGEIEVVDGGERIIVTSAEDGGAALDIPRVDTDDGTVKYQGTIPASEFAPGLDGVIGEFTFTATFDSEEHAATHMIGSIGTSGMTCTFERWGVATLTG